MIQGTSLEARDQKSHMVFCFWSGRKLTHVPTSIFSSLTVILCCGEEKKRDLKQQSLGKDYNSRIYQVCPLPFTSFEYADCSSYKYCSPAYAMLWNKKSEFFWNSIDCCFSTISSIKFAVLFAFYPLFSLNEDRQNHRKKIIYEYLLLDTILLFTYLPNCGQ